MKLISITLIALMFAPMAIAKNNKHTPSNGFCPPGLAKKSPACIPPGQAKKYTPGTTFPDSEYDWVLNPFNFDLPDLAPGEGYIQIGDAYVKVNRETLEIIDLFDALGKVLD